MFEEKCLEKNEIFNGDFLKFRKDVVELIDRSTATREFVTTNDASAVVAIDREENIYLVNQFRYAQQKELLELPAGGVEEGESFLQAAKRELLEETGLESSSWKELGSIVPTSFSNQKLHLFLAEDVEKTGALNLDEGEFLEVVLMPLKKALEYVRSGKIADSKTIIGILKVILEKIDYGARWIFKVDWKTKKM